MYCNLLNVCLIHFQINDMYCIYIYSPFHNSLPLFIIKVYTVGFITIYRQNMKIYIILLYMKFYIISVRRRLRKSTTTW